MSFLDVIRHHVLRHVCQTEAIQRCAKRVLGVVEDQLPSDVRAQRATSLFELPRIQASMRQEAQVDAAVI